MTGPDDIYVGNGHAAPIDERLQPVKLTGWQLMELIRRKSMRYSCLKYLANHMNAGFLAFLRGD